MSQVLGSLGGRPVPLPRWASVHARPRGMLQATAPTKIFSSGGNLYREIGDVWAGGLPTGPGAGEANRRLTACWTARKVKIQIQKLQ